jgi:hypothetical protein
MHAKVHYREKQISTHDLNMALTLEKQKKVDTYRYIRDKIKTSGVVFTTLLFLRNLRIGLIS